MAGSTGTDAIKKAPRAKSTPYTFTLQTTVRPMPPEPTPATRERRAQIRGLLYLALAAIAFSILRATLHSGLHAVFNRGWWRLW